MRATKDQENRILRNELIVADEKGNPTKNTVIDELPFTDTIFDVLQIYEGKAPTKIKIMQTGGINGLKKFEMNGDPLYKEGEEYILFLVDISHDKIHAKGNLLYRTVSPAGRYKIIGSNVNSFTEDPSTDSPKNLTDLETKIKQKD